MIDTATIWLDGIPPEQIVGLLDNVEERFSPGNGRHSLKGDLGNLTVKVQLDGLSVFGSLGRFILGSSLLTPSLRDIQRAVEKLSDTLSLPLHAASVYRFDVGACFEMELPVTAYLGVCGRAPRYKRIPYRTGLEYRNARRSLLLYDKLKQMRRKRQPVPDKCLGLNMLRVELQFKTRLKEQFGHPVTVDMLCDERFYAGVRERWSQEYLSIQKRRVLSAPVNAARLREGLALRGLHAMGEDEVLAMLNASREAGSLDDRQFYRYRAWLQKLATHNDLTVESSATLELTRSVQRQATGPL